VNIRIEPIKPHIGAVVHVDRAALLDEAVARRCLDALDKHGVLVFPRLGLSDAEQLAFTDRLGGRVVFTQNLQGGKVEDPNIYKLTLDPEVTTNPEYVLGSYFWHMDGMTSDIPPPKAGLLAAHRVAPKGGQTEFVNTAAAYDSLPADQKAEIAGLRVVHSALVGLSHVVEDPSEEDLKRWRATLGVKERPLVWTHKSGRKSLVLGITTDRIVGMHVAEGRALIARLLEWSVQSDFYYRHQWQEGDLVLWDNCSALHRVIPFAKDSGRMMHRTTIAGGAPLN
jgi:alpha-ketoglutarate-dependent taurine dioxygenase